MKLHELYAALSVAIANGDRTEEARLRRAIDERIALIASGAP